MNELVILWGITLYLVGILTGVAIIGFVASYFDQVVID